MGKEVSIIYVNYFSQDLLGKSIKSILNYHDGDLIEFIVVDNSGEYVGLGFEKIINPRENLGFGRAVNLGVKNSVCPFVLIINPDTLFKREFISAMRQNLNRDIVLISMWQIDERGSLIPTIGNFPNLIHTIFSFFPYRYTPFFIKKRFWPLQEVPKDRYLDKRFFKSVFGGVLFMNKEDFLKYGGFDESFFLYYEETDLCKRISISDKKCLILNSNYSYFHQIGGSSSFSKKNVNKLLIKSRFIYFKKHHGVLVAFLDNVLVKLRKKIVRLYGDFSNSL